MYDREVGYCQGSPFIVGMLLMQVKHICSPCNAKPLAFVTSCSWGVYHVDKYLTPISNGFPFVLL